MLNEYKKKRNFKQTPEPIPGKNLSGNGHLTFVVQKHSATRLHYDFRLEIDGVLISWAVPKGPSLNPNDKRLAAMTEDHPMEYASFEGVIPKGSYGAGPVIVWDEGTYAPDVDGKPDWNDKEKALRKMRAGLKSGKLSIFLKGEKMHGSWTLVKMHNAKGKDNNWLLIKHKDKFAKSDQDLTLEEKSVISNQTIEDIEAGRKRTKPRSNSTSKTSRSTKTSKSVKINPLPQSVAPMLATLIDKPFSDSQWIFEPKMDGIRAISIISERKLHIISRNGRDITRQYPSLATELAHNHTQKGIVFDGEIVALDAKGKPSFQLLQKRLNLSGEASIKSLDSKLAVDYYIFDILYLNGKDLTQIPLEERKKILEDNLVTSKHVHSIEYFEQDGEEAFKACIHHGLEGVVAKKLDSKYEEGRRSRNWLKIKTTNTAEFVVAGFTKGEGNRSKFFGALLLGIYDKDKKFKYVCNVGTGFNNSSMKDLLSKMRPLITDKKPFSEKMPNQSKITWLKPKLVAEIKFAEWTADDALRVPVFLHLRQDINPKKVSKPKTVTPKKIKSKRISVKNSKKKRTFQKISFVNKNSSPAARVKSSTEGRTEDILEQLEDKKDKIDLYIGNDVLPISSLSKAFWPAKNNKSSITKRDLLTYFTQVSPYLLPHLKDRPITLLRFPNGVGGEHFYQKHWEHALPEFVETVKIYSEHNKTDADYILCNNLSTLLWFAQIANLELHSWLSRIDLKPDALKLSSKFSGSIKNMDNSVLNYPDFIVFDLDPYIYSGKEKDTDEPELNRKAFKKTCEVAFMVKEVLDSISLNSFVKTTGKTGLHIFCPILRKYDYDFVREVAHNIGSLLVSQHATLITIEWSVAKRKGKIFFDYNMNTRGKTLASIYSPRAAINAAISMPIEWKELEHIYPTDFNIKTVPLRLLDKGDLWATILKEKRQIKL